MFIVLSIKSILLLSMKMILIKYTPSLSPSGMGSPVSQSKQRCVEHRHECIIAMHPLFSLWTRSFFILEMKLLLSQVNGVSYTEVELSKTCKLHKDSNGGVTGFQAVLGIRFILRRIRNGSGSSDPFRSNTDPN